MFIKFVLVSILRDGLVQLEKGKKLGGEGGEVVGRVWFPGRD